MFWIFMSVLALCATFLVSGWYWIKITRVPQNIDQDLSRRVERLEREQEMRKLGSR